MKNEIKKDTSILLQQLDEASNIEDYKMLYDELSRHVDHDINQLAGYKLNCITGLRGISNHDILKVIPLLNTQGDNFKYICDVAKCLKLSNSYVQLIYSVLHRANCLEYPYYLEYGRSIDRLEYGRLTDLGKEIFNPELGVHFLDYIKHKIMKNEQEQYSEDVTVF